MSDTLRYGVIGTGMMGLEHIRNLSALSGAEVTAYSDPQPESRRQARETAGPAAVGYADHRDLLRSAPVDVVVIASPNHTHASVLDAVFETDKHVLVEKPLCTTVDDAERIAERAARHRAVFWVGMEYRYKPPLARLIAEVEGGSVGRLHMLAIREHRFPFLKKVGDWNRFNRNTGGTLVEKCCHFFDLMRLITASEPVRVYASGGQDVNHLDERYDGAVPDILDNAFVTVDFENGTRALLDLCMFAEAAPNWEEVVATGDAGRVECLIQQSIVYVGRRKPFAIEKHEIPVEAGVAKLGGHQGATYFQHQALREAILSGKPAAVDADDGLRAVALGAAAQRSIEERRPIDFSGPGRG